MINKNKKEKTRLLNVLLTPRVSDNNQQKNAIIFVENEH
jgi:hypothetical protein